MLIKPKRVISLILSIFVIFSVMQIVVPAYSSGETDDTMPPAFVEKNTFGYIGAGYTHTYTYIYHLF